MHHRRTDAAPVAFAVVVMRVSTHCFRLFVLNHGIACGIGDQGYFSKTGSIYLTHHLHNFTVIDRLVAAHKNAGVFFLTSDGFELSLQFFDIHF